MLEDGYLKLDCLKIILGYKLKDEYDSSPTLPLYCSNYQKLNRLTKRKYTPIYSIGFDDLDNFLMVNETTGDSMRIFMLTTCGHCVLCEASKSRKMQYRCILESSVHSNPPMFVTLTYDEQYYPHAYDKDMKFVTHELQKFHKRLRKLMWSEGQPTDFKYLIVNEYGTQRKRLHYHAMYFGLHNCNYVPILNVHSDKQRFKYIYKFADLLRRAWPQGFVQCEVARDPSGKYVAKYLGKQNSKSLKSKFFGKEAIMQKLQEIRKYPRETNFSILHPLTGKTYDIPIMRYVSDLAYPTLCRQLPVDFRRKLLLFYQYGMQLYEHCKYRIDLQDIFTQVNFALTRYWRIIQLCGFHETDVTADIYDVHFNFSKFDELFQELNQYDVDIETIEYLKGLRDEHVLYSNMDDYDITITAYKALKESARLYRMEKDIQ